jgi:hypothetical protein
MKKIIFTLFLGLSGLAMSQTTTVKKLALIDGMLASQDFVNKNKQNIKSVTSITNAQYLPKGMESIAVSLQSPITNTQVKENYYDKISLATLNVENGLAAENPILFDGHLITNTQIKAIFNAVKHTEIITQEGRKILSISTSM